MNKGVEGFSLLMGGEVGDRIRFEKKREKGSGKRGESKFFKKVELKAFRRRVQKKDLMGKEKKNILGEGRHSTLRHTPIARGERKGTTLANTEENEALDAEAKKSKIRRGGGGEKEKKDSILRGEGQITATVKEEASPP